MANELKFADEELKSLSDLAQGYQHSQLSDNLEFRRYCYRNNKKV